MALEGTLRDFSFADILQLISLQRKTGVLTLKNEENVVTISFLEGKIVATSSLNQRAEDRLGLILLKQGAIQEAELEVALRKQEETLQRLGRILIDTKIVAGDTVRVALEQQILQIVYRIFRWTDGEYHFSQETDIDFDRDLMVPMEVDSIIMEGARMIDEWPFVNQRIPSREAIYRHVDDERNVEVVEEREDPDLLGFSFSDSPAEEEEAPAAENQITAKQAAVYELVNGRDSVNEIVLKSRLIDFETCKALAELLDRGLIREATPEEVVDEFSREFVPVRRSGVGLGAVPWLALPFLVLLGFSLSVMPRNPLNPSFSPRSDVWNRYVLETVSWFRLTHLLRSAETTYLLTGVYPDSPRALMRAAAVSPRSVTDPWGRPYRMVVRGHRILAAGTDSRGEPISKLLLSRDLAWEGAPEGEHQGPGVILLE